jgi:hypothetical protein
LVYRGYAFQHHQQYADQYEHEQGNVKQPSFARIGTENNDEGLAPQGVSMLRCASGWFQGGYGLGHEYSIDAAHY